MIATLAVAASLMTSEPVRPRLLATRDGALVRVDPAGTGSRTLLQGAVDAAWSPDGTQIVFARGGDLWTANDDGTGRRRLASTPAVGESDPTWSPDGHTIAYTAVVDGLRQVRARDVNSPFSRRLSPGDGEAWSPSVGRDPSRVAYLARATSGQIEIDVQPIRGGAVTASPLADESAGIAVTDARDLAWSPDGSRFAYTAVEQGGSAIVVQDATGATVFHSTMPAFDAHPVWSPDGTQLAYDTRKPDGSRALEVLTLADGAVHGLGRGAPLDWRAVPLGRPLFPDLVQRPPSGLVVTRSPRGHWLLGFTSHVDNRGPGALWVRGRRPRGSQVMTSSQFIQLAGGGVRVMPHAGELHFAVAPPHYHWHWLGYDRYELRSTTDFKLLVRDRKTGFCLTDHYGIAPGVPHGPPPRFLGECDRFEPGARYVQEGTSVGYTDRYPANYHGQNLNITGVPTGRYWLVHRVNSGFLLRERRYDNDAASLLVRIAWPGGHGAAPTVKTLRACHRERC